MQINMPILKPIQFPIGMGTFKTIKTYTREFEIYENYCLDIPGHPTILIPKGFIFDGASIPKIFRVFLSPVGILLIPGIVHDFAYRYNTLLCKKDKLLYYKKGAGKDFFDLLFLEMANYVNGLPKINKSAYLAVKWFGEASWDSHKNTHLF